MQQGCYMNQCDTRTADRSFVATWQLILCLGVFTGIQYGADADDTRAVRHIELTATLRILPAESGQLAVWIPVPQSSSFQSSIQVIRHAGLPLQRTCETGYGNEMLYGSGALNGQGAVEFDILWKVTRREIRLADSEPQEALTDAARAVWLRGSSKVPIRGKPLELIDARQLPAESWDQARLFYDRVLGHMSYDKSRLGYGTGDAVWACSSGFGNCTDFHSLFLSLARSHEIPARFEIGYPLPASITQGEIPGYHCWAWFHEQKHGWTPVDISEADRQPILSEYYFGNLSADRVAFSVGRNIELQPPQQGPTLNFFVEPYIEVDGKPVSDGVVRFSLSFRDVNAGTPE